MQVVLGGGGQASRRRQDHQQQMAHSLRRRARGCGGDITATKPAADAATRRTPRLWNACELGNSEAVQRRVARVEGKRARTGPSPLPRSPHRRPTAPSHQAPSKWPAASNARRPTSSGRLPTRQDTRPARRQRMGTARRQVGQRHAVPDGAAAASTNQRSSSNSFAAITGTVTPPKQHGRSPRLRSPPDEAGSGRPSPRGTQRR